ncbi:MAG TPA: universal stress protein [Actinoplanes sp.]|nr:universal stress protein [Actinoplanes sp.]
MTIIVGYVPRPEGRAALRRAIAEATLRDDDLLVINAARGQAWTEAGVATDDDLDSVRAELTRAGVRFDVRQIVRGKDPADEVIDAAEEVGAQLIVIGLRHRSAVGKLIMGSTSQRILLDAESPVLAVKADHAG